MSDPPDLQEYADYHCLSEGLVADATKTELVECARLLALEVAHYQAKFNESLREQALFTAQGRSLYVGGILSSRIYRALPLSRMSPFLS